jgi:hypothetical protein
MALQETGLILDLVVASIEEVKAAKADGHIDLAEVIKMCVDLAPKAVPALQNAKNLVSEWKDVKEADVLELAAKVPAAGKVGQIVAKAVVAAQKGKDLYVASRDLLAAVKA